MIQVAGTNIVSNVNEYDWGGLTWKFWLQRIWSCQHQRVAWAGPCPLLALRKTFGSLINLVCASWGALTITLLKPIDTFTAATLQSYYHNFRTSLKFTKKIHNRKNDRSRPQLCTRQTFFLFYVCDLARARNSNIEGNFDCLGLFLHEEKWSIDLF